MYHLSFNRMAILLVCVSVLYSTLPRKNLTKYVSGDHQISEGVSSYCDLDKCDSIYRKCTLTNRCDCDFKRDHICVKTCIDCLEEKLSVCCNCFDLCRQSVSSQKQASHVGEFKYPNEKRFKTLTETDDKLGRWKVEFPNLEEPYRSDDRDRIESTLSGYLLNRLVTNKTESQNTCSIAYITKYLHLEECKRYCGSMGATYYRWFRGGCCECVGQHCKRSGIGQPRCILGTF